MNSNIDFNGVVGKDCFIHGEFLLYSIALLSSAYTTMKVYKNQNTTYIIIFIILVSISYAFAITIEKVRENVLLWLSIVSFVLGCIYTWKAMNLKDNKQESFIERDKNASDKLQKDLKYDEQ